MNERLLDRLVELFKEDKELRSAIIDLIDKKVESEQALIDYRKSRTK